MIASECPHGTDYRYDQEFNVTIQKGKWYFFFTNIPSDPEIPLQMSVKSNNSVSLFAGKITDCPNGAGEPFLVVPGNNRYVRGFCTYRVDLGMISVGIRAEENVRVFVRLEGQHKENTTKFMVLKLVLILLVMLTLLFTFFCKVVLPNEMKQKYKSE
ncbi:hypothetical protein TRFO_10069 [Tritrichomonas foetus]|uniref:Uncharacterized protein n=1 Tax=Tritrichomonas foetus TaxID=1144522 RepID=A0A1J4JFD3_9EUKA|nr:hypothetical protein TRFO_10069 [Tritrichomonas foetus]|eukprot:OHS96165.1 hypothetical protein TRFO_10069 [Tritrichomonas foetus]